MSGRRKGRAPLDLTANRWLLFSHEERDFVRTSIEDSDRAPATKKKLLSEIDKVNRLTTYS